MSFQRLELAPEDLPGAPTVPRTSRVQSVDRAMILLRAVAQSPSLECTAALLAERTGLNRATAYRILSTLEDHRMVASDKATGQWSIGPGVIEVASQAGLHAVVRSASQVLERLSLVTGETAALAAVGATGGLSYVAEATPNGHPTGWLGREVPLHATSTGKALLAFDDPERVDVLCREPLVELTEHTITDPAALREELTRVRERGYAECHGELDADAWGVSGAVLDGRRVIAVLSVWGPYDRVSRARFAALGALTRDSADGLSRR